MLCNLAHSAINEAKTNKKGILKNIYVYLGGALAARHNVVERLPRSRRPR